VSYVITALDLQSIVSGNHIDKYADDSYLSIPAVNAESCAAEIAGVEKWAAANNLTLNRSKSVEIVFVAPRSKRVVTIPSPAVPGFQRVESLKILGVTISRKFSTTDHIDKMLAACAQTLFAMRTLRQHGLPADALHAVFQATVIGKLSYASPSWWGFANAADKARLEAFLVRSVRLGYRARHSTPSVPRPTTSCSSGSPATQDIFYILFFPLHVTATTNSETTRTNSLFLFVHLLSSTVTS
jgi:hypothetical protein